MRRHFYYKVVKGLKCLKCQRPGEGVLKVFDNGIKTLAGFKCIFCGNKKEIIEPMLKKVQKRFWAFKNEMDKGFETAIKKDD